MARPCSWSLALGFACGLFAQGQEPVRPTLRADSSVVLIPTHVTTIGGRPITDLRKKNFQVLEDNIEQPITYFAQDDAPVSVGLLLDISSSMGPRMRQAAEAAAAFFQTSNPLDEFFLVEFSDRARLTVPFTPDSGDLYQKIVHTRPFGRTSLLDAIHLALGQMKRARNDRKAIVILSDGGDNWSRHNVREVKRALVESEVQLYAMGLFDPDEQARPTREEKDGPALLEHLAQESGGRHYPVENLNDLPEVSRRISLDLRNEYVLGYHPDRGARDGKYHQVKVRLISTGDPRELRTFFRRGYYAPSD